MENISVNEFDLLLSKLSSPFVNKMALSTSRVLLVASSEVFNATFMKKEI